MVVKTANEFMADELLNRIRHLYKALNQAEQIMSKLEQENKRLQDVLNGLTSENNEDHTMSGEAFNGSVCTVY